MSDDAGEKSFAPTAKRRRDAAGKGDILRSRELATAVAFLAGTAWLVLAGPGLINALAGLTRRAWSFDAATLEAFDPGQLLLPALTALAVPMALLGTALWIATLLAQLFHGEGRIVAANLLPKASRLDPVAGLGRMFGPQGLIELGKSLCKVVLLGVIAWRWSAAHGVELVTLPQAPLDAQLAIAWGAVTSLLWWLGAGLVVIAAIDWPLEWWRQNSRLRMTQQEMRDEHKEAEGSPEKKGAIRQRQRELARSGVARAVREADFILTNPAHFSVALVYDPSRAAAPVVLAKGRDDKALAMRELAAELTVPVLEYPVLARSVYFTTRENHAVREELYVAIASVLAFVTSLRRGERRERPVVDVPDALRFDADGRVEAS